MWLLPRLLPLENAPWTPSVLTRTARKLVEGNLGPVWVRGEVSGLKAAFKAFTDRPGYCALGSVKSNIGHCLTAAGVAGIIKVLLSLQHRRLPPTINYRECNEHIAIKDSPFYINEILRPWPVNAGQRRRAAISSFGFSGTNAHIVLAEHAGPERLKQQVSVLTQDSRLIICLSARTEPQLRQMAVDLLAFVRKHEHCLDLIELAYTLQIGRDQMAQRLGLLVDSLQSLATKLAAFIAGEQPGEGMHLGQVRRHQEGMKLISQDDELKSTIVEKWLSQRKLSRLVDLWVKGLES